MSGPLPVELLSAYLDDPAGLSDEERRLVEARLESDPEARRMLAELRLIAGELGELPAMTAPRSYHLDAEMVGAPEPVVLHRSAAWYARHSGVVRWTTAAAAILFIFVLGADLVLNGAFSAGTGDDDDAAMPVGESQLSAPGDVDDEAGGMSGGAESLEPDVAEEEEAEEAGLAATEAEGGGEASDATTLESMVAPTPTPEASDQAAQSPTATEAAGAEESTPAITQGAGEGREGDTTMAAFDQETSGDADDDGAGRRPWRIAEFGLVVILGLLITAMVVLSRLPGSSGRRSG